MGSWAEVPRGRFPYLKTNGKDAQPGSQEMGQGNAAEMGCGFRSLVRLASNPDPDRTA